LTKDYRQFWDSIEPPLVKRSSSFSWSVEQTDTLLRVNKLEAYEVTNKMLKKRGNFGIKLVLSILNLITPRICTRLLAVTLIFLLGLLTGILLPSPTPKPTITTIEKRDINILKDKDIVAQLEKLKETNRNSAIFLSGYLKIQTPKTLPELPENSCVERGSDGTSFNIDLYPIDEAINLFKDLEEEKVKFKSDKDKIKMAVVQSTPKLNVMKCLPAAEIPTNQ
jgi:hypothetical protein